VAHRGAKRGTLTFPPVQRCTCPPLEGLVTLAGHPVRFLGSGKNRVEAALRIKAEATVTVVAVVLTVS